MTSLTMSHPARRVPWRPTLAVVLLVLVSGLLTVPATAHHKEGHSGGPGPDSGDVFGTVTDADSGDPIENATVTLEETGASDVTDADGNYRIENVEGGDYTATATADGFVSESTDVTVDGDVQVDFALEPSGPWVATESMEQGRHKHTATLLADGTVLVAGGEDFSDSSTDSVERYHPDTETWEQLADMPNVRSEHTATRLADDRMLMAGGVLGNVDVYDPATGEWSTAAPMNDWRREHTATLLDDGRVLVTGGRNSQTTSAAHDTAEIYDPTADTWTVTDSMADARKDHTATKLDDGRVLVVGGRPSQSSGALATAEVFDPDTEEWSQVASLSVARNNHDDALLDDGRVLAAGGADADSSTDGLTSTEIYDPAADSWKTVDDMSRKRHFHTVSLLNDGRVLATGGNNIDANGNSEVFDPDTGAWQPLDDLVGRRDWHAAAVLEDGRVLAAGSAIAEEEETAELFVP